MKRNFRIEILQFKPYFEHLTFAKKYLYTSPFSKQEKNVIMTKICTLNDEFGLGLCPYPKPFIKTVLVTNKTSSKYTQ